VHRYRDLAIMHIEAQLQNPIPTADHTCLSVTTVRYCLLGFHKSRQFTASAVCCRLMSSTLLASHHRSIGFKPVSSPGAMQDKQDAYPTIRNSPRDPIDRSKLPGVPGDQRKCPADHEPGQREKWKLSV